MIVVVGMAFEARIAASLGVPVICGGDGKNLAATLTRTMAADVEHWPTLDATAAAGVGDREEALARYRKVRDQLFQRIKARFMPESGPSV